MSCRRKEFNYLTETTRHGLRYGDWKFLFKKQDKWFNGVQELTTPLITNLTMPLITNLELGPLEHFHEARGFDECKRNHSWGLGPVSAQAGVFMKSLVDYPPRAKSFDMNIAEMLASLNPARTR